MIIRVKGKYNRWTLTLLNFVMQIELFRTLFLVWGQFVISSFFNCMLSFKHIPWYYCVRLTISLKIYFNFASNLYLISLIEITYFTQDSSYWTCFWTGLGSLLSTCPNQLSFTITFFLRLVAACLHQPSTSMSWRITWRLWTRRRTLW